METIAQEKLDFINTQIDRGNTILIRTHTRCVQITPRTAASWRKSGHTLFRVSGGSLWIARGRNWDCLDFCAISARGAQ